MMKKSFFAAISMLLCAGMLTSCSKPQTTAGNTAAPKREYKLGTVMELDPSAEDPLIGVTDESKVYQVVYDYSAADRSTLPKKLYAYDTLPVLPSGKAEPTEFGGCKLSINIAGDEGMPGERLVAIDDENLFNAFYETVASLDFSKSESTMKSGELTVEFKLTDGSGTEHSYTIDRLGNACLDGDRYSAEQVSEDATALFFAARVIYNLCSATSQPYTRSGLLMDGDMFKITYGDSTRTLSAEQAEEFLKLVSDEAGEFKCTSRFNCGAGEHGEKVLDISLFDSYSELDAEARHFSLYSDGKVVYHRERDGVIRSATLEHDHTFDTLFADFYYVSIAAFDVNAITSFVESIDITD